jgi:hypothetical protein
MSLRNRNNGKRRNEKRTRTPVGIGKAQKKELALLEQKQRRTIWRK